MIDKEELFDEITDKIQEIDSLVASSVPPEELKNEFLRFLHNIKGTCGMFEEESLAEYCHTVESLLQDLSFSKDTEDLVLSTIGQIESYMKNQNQSELNFEGIFKKEENPPPKLEVVEPEKKNEGVYQSPLNALPQVDSAATKPLIADPNFMILSKLEHQLNVAVIDDESEICQSIAKRFRHYQIHVDVFYDGKSFIDSAKIHSYDLVITDKNLPGIDGLEIIKCIKEKQPLLPIIFLSGFLSEEAMLESSQLGVSAIISKPFKLPNLVRLTVNNALIYYNNKLLQESFKLMSFMLGTISFQDELNLQDIKELQTKIKNTKLEMIKIKRYFSALPLSRDKAA